MIVFSLTVEEVNLVLKGLMELPAKMSLPMIQKLEVEAKEQLDVQAKEVEKKLANEKLEK